MDSPQYRAWFVFGHDHNKHDTQTLLAFLNDVNQPVAHNTRKPELLFLTERYCTQLSGIPNGYLEPRFFARSFKVPCLRQVFAFNDIRYGRDITKVTLINLFADRIDDMRAKNNYQVTESEPDNLSALMEDCDVSKASRNSRPSKSVSPNSRTSRDGGSSSSPPSSHSTQQSPTPAPKPKTAGTTEAQQGKARIPQESAGLKNVMEGVERVSRIESIVQGMSRSQRVVGKMVEDLLYRTLVHIKNEELDQAARELSAAARQIAE